jgi:hypothetical protein
MTSIQTRRANVLAEAVVSSYINELATPRERRPVRRPERERTLARAPRRARSVERSRPALVTA